MKFFMSSIFKLKPFNHQKKILYLYSIFICLILSTISCSSKPSSSGSSSVPKDVVATYKGGQVTLGDLQEWIGRLPEAKRTPPEENPEHQWEKDIILVNIAPQFFLKKAEEKRINEDASFKFLLDRAEKMIMLQSVEQDETKKFQVTPEEIEQYYKDNIEGQHAEPKLLLRHIFMRFPWQATEAQKNEVKNRIEEVSKQIKQGADFEEMVKKYSESETAEREGALNWRARGAYPKTFDDAAWNLKIGEVSEPAYTDAGYHIIMLEGKDEGRDFPLEELRENIASRLKNEKQEKVIQDLRERILKGAEVFKNPKAALEAGIAQDEVVAKFNDWKLTRAEFDRYKEEDVNLQNQVLNEEFIARLLDNLILIEAYWQEGIKRELQQSQNYQQMLQLNYNSLMVNVLKEKFLEQELAQMSKEAFKTWFEDHIQFFKPLPKTHLGLIYIPFSETEQPWTTYNKALTISRDVKEGKIEFSEVAKKYSQHDSAKNGGDLGYITNKEFDNLFDGGGQTMQPMLAIKVGEVSEPIKALTYNLKMLCYDPHGYYIFKVYDKEEKPAPPLEEIVDKVKSRYIDFEKSSVHQRMFDEVAKEYNVQFYEDNMRFDNLPDINNG